MDSSKSQWNKYVTDENILGTSKMFYGKYPYRAELHIPGCWLMHSPPRNFTVQYFSDKVKDRQKKYANSGSMVAPRSWQNLREREIMDADAEQLYLLCKLRKSRPDIRTRVEETTFNLYTKTAEVMTEILDSTPKFSLYVTNISLPPKNIPDMAANIIYAKNPLHKFKIMLREGRYDPPEKQQIAGYLANFPDKVTIPYGLDKKLQAPTVSYLSGYYFVDDEQVIPFLRMISPNFVKNIYRIEQLQ